MDCETIAVQMVPEDGNPTGVVLINARDYHADPTRWTRVAATSSAPEPTDEVGTDEREQSQPDVLTAQAAPGELVGEVPETTSAHKKRSGKERDR